MYDMVAQTGLSDQVRTRCLLHVVEEGIVTYAWERGGNLVSGHETARDSLRGRDMPQFPK
jgi:hypothetical protein